MTDCTERHLAVAVPDLAGYDEADLLAAAAAGIRAPSLHNSQPWLFGLRDGSIEVRADPARRLLADRTGWAVRVACGAAAFNAGLALALRGRPAQLWLRPEATVLARLSPLPPRPATRSETGLAASIPHRHSNREPFWPDPVPADARADLVAAAQAEGAWLDLLIGTTALRGVAEIARSADRVLRRDPGYSLEVATWAEADAAADGVPVRAGGPVGDLLPVRPYGGRSGRMVEPEPLVAVLGVAGDSAADQVRAGAALQRVLLTAYGRGLAASMISQPIEVPAAREQVRRALGRSGSPQMMLRIGYGVRGNPTQRRPLAEVLLP